MGINITIWRSSKPGTSDNLEILNLDPEPVSLDDATIHLPSGGYTTFRTYNSRFVLRLSEHIERLEISARLAEQTMAFDHEKIRKDLHQVLSQYQHGDARVRVIVDLKNLPGTLYYLTENLKVPSKRDYQQGVHVITRHLHRSNPLAKLTCFVEKANMVRQQLPPKTNEAIMISDDGSLLEGLSSNFFAIQKSTVWTANEGILPGITRSLVLEVVNDLSIPLRMAPVSITEVQQLDEAFITSASRAVLPVTMINGKPVGDGSPGLITQKILARYLEHLASELEII